MEKEGRLKDEERRELLSLARKTIESHLKGESLPDFIPLSDTLKSERGAFVSLHKNDQLRGCIGTFISHKPLYETVTEMAIAASTQDPRFPPVTIEELPHIVIEISVLSPLRKIKDISEIEVGRHGIYIVNGFNRGCLLPQVATEYGWDRKTFLEKTCLKAGLSPDEWREGTDIYIFSAEVFGESHKEG